MWTAVARKELRENRWKWLTLSGVLIATAILAQVMLGPLAEILTGVQGGEMAPLLEAMRQQMSDPLRYFWSNWYAKNLYQMITIFSILMGMSTIAGEVSRGTAAFLFTRPMTRRLVLSAKIAAGYGVMATVVIGTTLVTMLIAQMGDTPLPARFLLGLPMALHGGLVLYLIAVILSILVDDPVKAGASAAVVMMMLSVPGWIKGWGAYSIFRQMAGIPILLAEPWPVVPALILTGAAVLGYVVAVTLLNRKEFTR